MSERITYINEDKFDEEIIKSQKPVILDIFANHCPPCEHLAPIYEKMAERYEGEIKFLKMIRNEINNPFLEQFNLGGSPQVLFFKDGQEIGQRLTGYLTLPEVKKAIQDTFGLENK